MSPKRTRKGFYIVEIDWTAKLGFRVDRSSETKSLREHTAFVELLYQLRENGQVDTLRAFAEGRIAAADLKQARRSGRLKADDLLTQVALRKSLWQAIEETLPAMGRGALTRKRYDTSLAKLRRLAGKWLAPGVKDPETKQYAGGATVADLKAVDWHQLAREWPGSGSDWNHLQRAVSSFLTAHFGDVFHPERRAVMNRKYFPRKRENERVPDLPIAEFVKLLKHVPDYARPIYWTIVLCGFRWGEYSRAKASWLRPKQHAVAVMTRKSADGAPELIYVDKAMWRWVELGIPSPLAYQWTRTHFKRAAEAIGRPELTLHDLRHCLGQWADDAGATEAQIQQVLRHSTPSMTRRYVKRRNKGEVARLVGSAIQRATSVRKRRKSA